MTDTALRALLKTHGFRATEGKIQLLTTLKRSGKPLSVQGISDAMKSPPHFVTLYRMLHDLAEKGIIRRVDLHSGSEHYEFTPEKPHHHHLVCTDCGTIEDIEHCTLDRFERSILSSSRSFRSIRSHTLEFFGTCTSCAV